MDGAALQAMVVLAGRVGFLEVHLGAQQVGLGRVQVAQHGGRGQVPPCQAAQIGLVQGEVAPGQVHAREHGADGRAMDGLRRHLRTAFELADDGGRLAVQGRAQRALVVGHGRGHQHAALGQVAHQFKVEGQLVGAEVLEDRQHVFATVGRDEEIAVLDARRDALDGQGFA